MASIYSWIKTKPFIVFSFILILKIYMVWFVIFDSVLLWKPFVTGLPSIWVIFCLIEWFASKRKLVVYMIVDLLTTTVFFAAIMYYKYYGVIVTYHALQQVNQVAEVKGSVFSLADPYYLLIYVDIVAVGILYFINKKAQNWSLRSRRKGRKSMIMAVFVISLFFCLINIWPNRAIMNEIKQAEEMGILNYEAHTIFKSQDENVMDAALITPALIKQVKGISDPAAPQYWAAAKGRNVIVIQMESLQNFLIGLDLDGQEVMPTMNKLKAEHLYFPHFFQQVGQGNTSDAEFVVNTSFYIPPYGAASQEYADKELPSLPKLLGRAGYQSATFHTNGVEFWNRKELYKAIGFDRYYDQTYFGDQDAVMFGASDETLFAKTADALEKMQANGKPFYAHIITMSAHHPYNIPVEKQRLKLPERYVGTLVGDYLRAQNYADYALGLFVARLQKSGLWDNSLIVIYGDHLGLAKYMLDSENKALMEGIFKKKYEYPDMLNIPLIIAVPGADLPQVHQSVGGQVDLLPTIANLTGVSLGHQIHFGQDLLNQTVNLLPERYYLPSGSFINNSTLVVPGSGFFDSTKYSLSLTDKTKKRTTKDEYDRALKLLYMSDSFIRHLPQHK